MQTAAPHLWVTSHLRALITRAESHGCSPAVFTFPRCPGVRRAVLGDCHLLPLGCAWRCRARLASMGPLLSLRAPLPTLPTVPKVPAAPRDESWEQETRFPSMCVAADCRSAFPERGDLVAPHNPLTGAVVRWRLVSFPK